MTRTNASHHSSSRRPGAAFLAATRPLGRAALSCGLAGALSLGAAGAALANGHDGGSRAGGGQGRAAGAKASTAAPHKAESGRPAEAATSSRPQQRDTVKKMQDEAGKKTTGSQHASRAPQQQARGADASTPNRGHDPRGNNGTIKVDGPVWDARVDNEPHTSCAFRVTFFGFDEGQTADIMVTGVAPTVGGVLLHETAVPTSDDAAGGAAHDFDGATRVYTADDLGLDAVTPHPQQGYHLKVAVDSLEAPGGAKQKVLWLEPCQTEAPVTRPEVGGFEEGAELPTASRPATAGTPAGSESLGGANALRAQHAAVAAPAAVRAEAAAYREGAPRPVEQESSMVAAGAPMQQAGALPTSLAFTGAEGLGLLALTGAAAAAAGAGLLVARRRAATQGA